MKLKDVKLTEPALAAVNEMITERMTNLGIEMKRGQPPLSILLGEICTIEIKLDALMHLIEDKAELSFKMYSFYIEMVAKSGTKNILAYREALTAKPKSPLVVAP